MSSPPAKGNFRARKNCLRSEDKVNENREEKKNAAPQSTNAQHTLCDMELKQFFIESVSGWWLWECLIRSDKMSKKRATVLASVSSTQYATDIFLMSHHHHRPSSLSRVKWEKKKPKLFCIFMLNTIAWGQRTRAPSYFMYFIIFVCRIVECAAVFLDIFEVPHFEFTCFTGISQAHIAQRRSKHLNQTRNSYASHPLHPFKCRCVSCGT